MTFANPAGAWALLALLAVLAIHLLQRRRRRVIVSTLFLLERQRPVSLGGRRLERLRRSASLWLQLAAVALLAYVLMLPLRLLEDSRQKVAIVVDSSVSMSAFRAALRAELGRRVAEIARAAAKTEWTLVESVAGRRPLYSGVQAEALLGALDAWEPREAHHDPRVALDNARALAGPGGRVLFATDHDVALPEGFERLSVGRPLDNVGLAGLEVESAAGALQIRAVVRNYGRAAARRDLWLEAGQTPTHKQRLELGPGEMKALTLPFPPDRDALVLALEADGFTLDDRAPVVRPRPKRLRARLTSDDPTVRAWLDSLVSVERAEPADVVLGPEAGSDALPYVRWLPGGDTRRVGSAPVAERHPLVEGLSWHGLVAPPPSPAETAPNDEVLVWSGPRPLVVLRGSRGLHLNFPVAGSNAEKVPALLLLLHRFLDGLRRDKIGEEHLNVECGQALTVATRDGEPPPRLEWEGAGPSGGTLRAPWRPATFEVRVGNDRRVVGAAHFADVREANLTQASSSHVSVAEAGEVRRRHTRDDPLFPLWVALLGALLLADWGLAQRGPA